MRKEKDELVLLYWVHPIGHGRAGAGNWIWAGDGRVIEVMAVTEEVGERCWL